MAREPKTLTEATPGVDCGRAGKPSVRFSDASGEQNAPQSSQDCAQLPRLLTRAFW